LQDPPKFTQIWIFGLKTNHLATLVCVQTSTAHYLFTEGQTAQARKKTKNKKYFLEFKNFGMFSVPFGQF
jgi:hypothetical protein